MSRRQELGDSGGAGVGISALVSQPGGSPILQQADKQGVEVLASTALMRVGGPRDQSI